MSEETEIIDKLFLELSQFTKATTSKEFKLKAQNEKMREALELIRCQCDSSGEYIGDSGMVEIAEEALKGE